MGLLARNKPSSVTLRCERRLGGAKIWRRERIASRPAVDAKNAKAGQDGRLFGIR
jgi:hypothetical protein